MSLDVSCAGCGSLLKYESEKFTGDLRAEDEQRALRKWLEGHNCCLVANGLGIGKAERLKAEAELSALKALRAEERSILDKALIATRAEVDAMKDAMKKAERERDAWKKAAESHGAILTEEDAAAQREEALNYDFEKET